MNKPFWFDDVPLSGHTYTLTKDGVALETIHVLEVKGRKIFFDLVQFSPIRPSITRLRWSKLMKSLNVEGYEVIVTKSNFNNLLE